MNTSSVPDIWPTRKLPYTIIDNQLRDDPANFYLDENMTSALSAVLTGLCMLLLADIVSCITVRAHDNRISSFCVYRYYLLSRVTNPVSFSTWAMQRSSNTKHSNVESDTSDSCFVDDMTESESVAPPGPAFPWYARVFILFVGVALVFVELLFMFLATTVTTPYDVDRARIPSFILRDDGSHETLNYSTYLQGGCNARPITEKARFVSVANYLVCAEQTEVPIGAVRKDEAFVEVGMTPYLLRVKVDTDGILRTVTFERSIILRNISKYSKLGSVTPEDVRRVIPAALNRRGIPAKVFKSIEGPPEPSTAVGVRSWGISFRVNLSRLSLPSVLGLPDQNVGKREERPGVPRSTQSGSSIAWNMYLGNVTVSTIHISTTGNGSFKSYRGHSLEHGEVPLVKYQRPRMSLRSSLLLSGCLGIVWLLIFGFCGWGPSIDHRMAWARVLERKTKPGVSQLYMDSPLFP